MGVSVTLNFAFLYISNHNYDVLMRTLFE